MTRRHLLSAFDKKYSELGDPLLKPASVLDFAKLAQAKLDPLAWDYMDEGSDDEASLRANREGFDRFLIRPHFLLHDVATLDLTVTLFGKKWEHPIFLCPTGGKNCFFPNGEREAAYGAGLAKTMFVTRGGVSDALKENSHWWQFTTAAEFRTKNQMVNFGEKLEDQGCAGIIVTVDIYQVSHRERSIRNGLVRGWCEAGGIPRQGGQLKYNPDDVLWTTGDLPAARPFPTPTWDTLKQLRDSVGLPIVIKGVMTAEDTAFAVKHGMSGVVVSNHGARQLDHVGGTIEALPECVQAASGKIPVLLDGGIRRGTDIFKALALGASAVGIGRPYLWGLSTFGRRGVARVVDLLRAEFAKAMGMAGVARPAQIDASFVRRRG
jgi:4-hydroxymandelate oxidase